ncbi:MAG TPA: hypothetical protein VG815_01070 [Chloroflexota bacterium]|nr:hypothetical protein [Chloroflexota bacterium]
MTDRNAENDLQGVGPENQELRHGASRGDFLKWGTVALGGMYVAPKISSFAVEKSLGHAGSVGPVPGPPVPPSTQTFLPSTGGAANLTPEQRRELMRKRH